MPSWSSVLTMAHTVAETFGYREGGWAEALLVDVAAIAARSRQAEQLCHGSQTLSRQAEQLRQCSHTLSRQAEQLRQCSQTLHYAAAIHGGQPHA